MKKTLITLLAIVLLGFATNAQTNIIVIDGVTYVPLTSNTNTLVYPNTPVAAEVLGQDGKTYGSYELTFGGAGETLNGKSYFGLDFSLSTNPFECRPEVWIGIAQSLYWEPSFAGSTDLFVDWSQNIWKEKLYLNVGWSGGALYDTSGDSAIWRTGPEVTFEYYTTGNAFIFAGVNYDVYRSDKNEGGFRYSFGIGLTF